MSQFAVKCIPSPGVFTRHGKVLVHESRAELEFLFPHREIVDVTRTELPTMRWADHPDMATVQWPLRREDFR